MAAFFVFATAFVVYAWTASPVMGWLDAPEFIAASAELGVPHSPGHPVPVMVGKLAALVPIGDVAFRVNLASSLAAAGAVTCVFIAARRVLALAADEMPERIRTISAGALACGLGFTFTVWFQGVRAEVYALEGMLMAGVVAAVLRAMGAPAKGQTDGQTEGQTEDAKRHDPRWLGVAGLLGGLGLATHHFISLTVMVPAAVALLSRRLTVRAAAATTALIVLGLAAYLYLPVRSSQHPTVNWGAPHTAERFAWSVSARAFHKATTAEQVSTRGEDAAQILTTLGEQATWPLFLLALCGVYLGVRRKRWRRPALMLAGVVGLGVAGRVLIGFDPEIPDDHGYITPCMCALFVLALAGAGGLFAALVRSAERDDGPDRRLVDRLAWALCAILIALPPVQLWRFGARASLATARASDDLARWELQELPPRTLLLLSYFQTAFRLWALRTTENARPDIVILDRSFLTYPGMAAEARLAHPDLAQLIDAPLAANAPTPVSMLQKLARTRPVAAQLHFNLEASLDPWLVPAGGFARLLPDLPGDRARTRTEAGDFRARAALAELIPRVPPGDWRGLRDALLWHDFTRASIYCRLGRRRAAQQTVADALQLAPQDVTLHALAVDCRLSVP